MVAMMAAELVVRWELHLAETMVEMKADLRDGLSVVRWELHLAETMVGCSAGKMV